MFESDLFNCGTRISAAGNREKLNSGNGSMADGLRLLLSNPDIFGMNSLETFLFYAIQFFLPHSA